MVTRNPRFIVPPIINSGNVTRLTQLNILQPPVGAVLSLAFSPNSKVLALGCSGNPIGLWSVDDGTLLGTLPFGSPAEGVTFHPNGNTLIAVSGNYPKFSLWDINRQVQIKWVNVPIGHQPYRVVITPTGQTIATGSLDGHIFFWNWSNGDPTLRSTLTAHHTLVLGLAFSPDGSYLASGAGDGEVCIWRVGFDLVPELHAKIVTGGSVEQVSFNGDGTMVTAVSRDDGKLYLINVGDGRVIAKLSEPLLATDEQMFAGAFAPTEQLIAACQSSAANANAFLEFWDASTQALLMAKPLFNCDKVQFSPDGRVLLVIVTSPTGPDIPTIWGIPILLAPLNRI